MVGCYAMLWSPSKVADARHPVSRKEPERYAYQVRATSNAFTSHLRTSLTTNVPSNKALAQLPAGATGPASS
jgi:hypothetical protein